jgi:hypothetical protein
MTDSAVLFVDETGAAPDRIELLAGLLRAELSSIDDVQVGRATSSNVPEGARSGEVVAAGALVVALGRSGALGVMIDLARRWLARSPSPGRTVKVQVGGDVLELSGASEAVEQQLVAAFVARHS